ncbi:MAG: nuclease [Thermoprotei archaeon ex4572_64]|nr:MAG: nuclease [Thermoprotei archaeon ex4572_64]
MKIMGIDLAVPGKFKTGIAVLELHSKYIFVKVIDSINIVDEVVKTKPQIVAIDAPLTTPSKGINRLIEIRARRFGLKLLPPLMSGMRRLTEYAIEIKNILKSYGVKVIEVHPSSTLKVMNMSREVCAITGLLYYKQCYASLKDEYNQELILPCPEEPLKCLRYG